MKTRKCKICNCEKFNSLITFNDITHICANCGEHVFGGFIISENSRRELFDKKPKKHICDRQVKLP